MGQHSACSSNPPATGLGAPTWTIPAQTKPNQNSEYLIFLNMGSTLVTRSNLGQGVSVFAQRFLFILRRYRKSLTF